MCIELSILYHHRARFHDDWQYEIISVCEKMANSLPACSGDRRHLMVVSTLQRARESLIFSI